MLSLRWTTRFKTRREGPFFGANFLENTRRTTATVYSFNSSVALLSPMLVLRKFRHLSRVPLNHSSVALTRVKFLEKFAMSVLVSKFA